MPKRSRKDRACYGLYDWNTALSAAMTGCPCGPRWFCDNRVAFQADDDGIADIHYFSPQGAGHTMVFHRAFWGGIRLYLCDETHNYQLRPAGLRHSAVRLYRNGAPDMGRRVRL